MERKYDLLYWLKIENFKPDSHTAYLAFSTNKREIYSSELHVNFVQYILGL